LSLALHGSPFLRISSNLSLLPLHPLYSRIASFNALNLRSSCAANRCSGRGRSFDRARDQRRLKARAMCSVRKEASSKWRADLRMRFIKRKSLETGRKSRSGKLLDCRSGQIADGVTCHSELLSVRSSLGLVPFSAP
jgi:hypothetical protein